MKLLLFDIDGTLLLTGGVGKIAFEKAFEELFGIAGVWQDVIPDGKTDPKIIHELLNKIKTRTFHGDDYSRLCERYLEHFEREIERADRFRLMPGVLPLIPDLHARHDLVMGVATGNFERTARLKLRKGNLEEHFPFGGYGSDSADRVELSRKAIDRGKIFSGNDFLSKNIYLIGDTIHDIRAGKELGTKTLAVATGRTTFEELKNETPTYLLDFLPDSESFLQLISQC